jgi:hypothetical protein
MPQKELSCYGRYNKDRPWRKKLKKKKYRYQQQAVRAKAEVFVIHNEYCVSTYGEFKPISCTW